MSAAASVVWAAAAAAAGAARTPTEAWLRPARVAGLPPGLYGKPLQEAGAGVVGVPSWHVAPKCACAPQ